MVRSGQKASSIVICSDAELREQAIARNKLFDAARAKLSTEAYKALEQACRSSSRGFRPRPLRPVISLVEANGVYKVPVVINGVLPLQFVLDSGAADVSLPAAGRMKAGREHRVPLSEAALAVLGTVRPLR